MKKQKTIKNKIEFESRYPNVWSKLIRDKKHKKLWEYKTNGNFVRYGWNSDNPDEIVMVDPEGGPCLSVGDKIEKKTIVKIFREHVNGNIKVMFELK